MILLVHIPTSFRIITELHPPLLLPRIYPCCCWWWWWWCLSVVGVVVVVGLSDPKSSVEIRATTIGWWIILNIYDIYVVAFVVCLDCICKIVTRPSLFLMIDVDDLAFFVVVFLLDCKLLDHSQWPLCFPSPYPLRRCRHRRRRLSFCCHIDHSIGVFSLGDALPVRVSMIGCRWFSGFASHPSWWHIMMCVCRIE